MTIVGAPSLAKLPISVSPLPCFIEATFSEAVYPVVSLVIVFAIFNAVL